MNIQNVGTLIAASLIVLMTVAVWAQNDASNRPRKATTRWQHMAVTRDEAAAFADPEFSRQIMRVGDEGWELVDVESISEEGTTTKTVFFFKKPK